MFLAVLAAAFQFTLAQGGQTSAGIYRTSDGSLVRTLWSNVHYDAGSFFGYWDGNDDDGDPAANGPFRARVLTSQVSYTWQGVIGNTSTNFTGATVYNNLDFIRGMTIVGTTAYLAVGYTEGNKSQWKISLSTPQERGTAVNAYNWLFSWFVDSDGTNVYWGGWEFGEQSMVFATAVADDSEVTFSSGDTFQPTYSAHTYSVLAKVIAAGSKTTGLAVQKTGSLIFVANGPLDRIDIANKTTGATVKTDTTFENPGPLACDGDNNLWIAAGAEGSRTVKKYSVAGNGDLTLLGTVSDLSIPVALAVAPDNSVMAIADGGATQQLKAYDVDDLGSAWTYGTAGGYADSPAVADNKFYFRATGNCGGAGTHSGFITYEPDSTFWVGDIGNRRAQHYSAAREFIERIQYLGCSYSARVDPNDPERAFSDFLEFSVDYSKSLSPTNGSWTLVRNWGWEYVTGEPGSSATWNPRDHVMRGVATLNNGRTYALLFNQTGAWNYGLFELPAAGGLRYIQDIFISTTLFPDGSLRTSDNPPGDGSGSQTITKKVLTGFDGSNNPQWAAPATLIVAPAGLDDPVDWDMSSAYSSRGQTTSSDVYVSFDQDTDQVGHSHSRGYHLGGIDLEAETWKWRTSKSTDSTWPCVVETLYNTDGTYENGRGVIYAGGMLFVLGQDILWGYRGENWCQVQAGYWHHFRDDGLMVGMFGADSFNGGQPNLPAVSGMAGNVISGQLIVGTDGKTYLYHNDESHHSGVHRWLIDGLDTITEQESSLSASSKQGPGLITGGVRMQ